MTRHLVGQWILDWLYTRWLELRLGWLSIKQVRLEYQLRELKKERSKWLKN